MCWFLKASNPPMFSPIKDVVRSSVKFPEFDKHPKKAVVHIVEITIKMKTIVRKPLMIKITKLRLRNLDNFSLFVHNHFVWSSDREQWSVCISESERIFCVPFSWTDSSLCIYHLSVWSNLNFLHNSRWIPFSTELCPTKYFLRYSATFS